MKKKLCSMALTILVMISSMAFCLPAVSAVEIGAGGWIWIEAEEYTDKSDNYTLYNSPESSNAQNMLLVLSPDVKNEYLEYSFNIETDGEYVIWALSSPGNSLWASPWKYSVNGGAEGDMSTVSQTGETVYVSTEGHGQAIGWYRLNMVNLTSGTNTLKFISNQGGAGNGLQYHLLDAIAIVPSTFNWTPSGLERPSFPAPETGEGGWIWMEAERYTNKSENYVLRYLEDSSNGQNMTVDIYTDVKEEYLEYSFNIKDTERYAIWALSSPGNSLWVCPWKFSVNGGAKTDMLNTAQTGETVYVSTEGRGQPIGWYRLSIIDLNSGLNTLRFIADQGGEGNGIQYHLLDAIAIVPTSFNWTPSGLERPSPAQELPELGGGEPTIGSDYVWIEGENCTRQSGEYVLTTDEEGKQNYSDGSAAVAVVNNPTSPLSLEYEFVLPEANAYQIWLRGTAEGNTVAGTASASTFLWSMDGAEAEPAANGRTQQLYTAANNNQASYQTGVIDSNTTSPMPNYTIAWHYVGTKDLAAGDHTLEILVNDITDDGFYRSLVDCICIVPVNYQWNPMLINYVEKPVAPATDMIVIEGENYTTHTFIPQTGEAVKNPNYSAAGRYLDDPNTAADYSENTLSYMKPWLLNTTDGQASGGWILSVGNTTADGDYERLTYQFRPQTSGNYDIYTLMTTPTGWTTVVEVGLDDAEPARVDGASWSWYMPANMDGNNTVFQPATDLSYVPIPMSWNRLQTNVSLSADETHTLTFDVVQRSIDASRSFSIDCIVLIPSDATDADGNKVEIDSTDIPDTANIGKVNINQILLNKEAVMLKLPEQTDSDLNLPASRNSITGVTWTSNHSDVIAADGTVIPKEEETQVTLTVNYTNRLPVDVPGVTFVEPSLEPVATRSFVITVPGKEYVVTDFALAYDDLTQIGSELIGEATVTASASIQNNMDAEGVPVLILALYNADNEMVDYQIAGGDALGSGASAPFVATLTLPKEVSGYELQAFVWDGMSTIKPLAASITKPEV